MQSAVVVPQETSASRPSSDAAGNTSAATGRSECVNIPPYATGNTCVFKYDEFQADKLAHGQDTVNQLVQKFGTPKKAYGYKAPMMGVGVTVEFPGVEFSMYPLDGASLSFSGSMDANQETVYPLTAQDMAVKMNLIDQTVTDPAFPLSRGLKIGTSTHDDVLAAHPAGSFLDDDSIATVFYYIWSSEYDNYKDGTWSPPYLIYRYDQAGKISNVSFGWIVID